jgi:hypothetical protein
MKDLINKFKTLKSAIPQSPTEIEVNKAIDQCIDIVESLPIIHAKALRKRGTDEWYYYSTFNQGWFANKKSLFRSMETYSGIANLPPDAEEVELLIIEKPKT